MRGDAIYLRRAALLAQRSKCLRLQVGCVVTTASGVVLGGAFNAQRGVCTGAVGACGCAHAEDGAIECASDGRAIAHVYCTHQPCVSCARTLAALGGVRLVRWLFPYRLPDGAELLIAAGIDARRFDP
jgi:deoxycytidylate deaminase